MKQNIKEIIGKVAAVGCQKAFLCGSADETCGQAEKALAGKGLSTERLGERELLARLTVIHAEIEEVARNYAVLLCAGNRDERVYERVCDRFPRVRVFFLDADAGELTLKVAVNRGCLRLVQRCRADGIGRASCRERVLTDV